MALSRTNLLGQITAGNFGTGNFTSSSFTPANNSLLVVEAFYVENNGTTTDPTSALTISDSSTLTWTQQATAVAAPTAFPSLVKIWTAPVATGSSMTVTLSTGGRTAGLYAVSVVCYTGYDTGTPVGGTATGSQNGGFSGPPTPISITLSASPATGDEVFGGVFADKSTTGITQGSAFTEIDDLFNSNWGSAESQIRTGSTSTTVDWVDLRPGGGALFNFAAVAITVKAASATSAATPQPIVATRPAPVPAATALLRRGTLADPPVLTTPGPYVVTAPTRPAFSVPVLLRNPAQPPPSAQPLVVTKPAAPVVSVPSVLRSTLADPPVLTTVSPIVVTAPVTSRVSLAILLSTPQAGPAPASGPTTVPIVVTAPSGPPGATIRTLRAHLQDAIIATPQPIVVTAPVASRPAVPIVARSSLADPAAAPSPIVIAGRPPAAASFVALVRNPQPAAATVATSSPKPELISVSSGLDRTSAGRNRDLITYSRNRDRR